MKSHPEVDNHKLIYHPERVSEWIQKGDCYPIYVEIGPTNSCNHKCIFCALDWLKKGVSNIDSEVLVRSLEEMAEVGVKSVMFAGEGEPLLHKEIGLFTKTAKQYGLDVSMTTNGVLFTQSKIEGCIPNLSWIRFSIDSGSAENYSLVHGTNSQDFERLIYNINESVKFRDKNKLDTIIGAQFLAISQNSDEAIKLVGILKKIGVDNLQIKPYSHHPSSAHDFTVTAEYYDQLEKKLEKFNSRDFKVLFRKKTIERLNSEASYSQCYGLPFFALIDSRGDIFPCNLFYGKKEASYGNLYDKSFLDIWQGEKRKKILEKMNEKGVSDCRKGCRLDTINRYLDRLKNPSLHDNFI